MEVETIFCKILSHSRKRVYLKRHLCTNDLLKFSKYPINLWPFVSYYSFFFRWEQEKMFQAFPATFVQGVNGPTLYVIISSWRCKLHYVHAICQVYCHQVVPGAYTRPAVNRFEAISARALKLANLDRTIARLFVSINEPQLWADDLRIALTFFDLRDLR